MPHEHPRLETTRSRLAPGRPHQSRRMHPAACLTQLPTGRGQSALRYATHVAPDAPRRPDALHAPRVGEARPRADAVECGPELASGDGRGFTRGRGSGAVAI